MTSIEFDTQTGEFATSGDFYRARGASAIMRAANFPDDLLAFLQLESLAVLQSVRQFHCDMLVEMGCYDGRAIEVARSAGIPYLGIDINDDAVELLRRRIISEGLQRTANAVAGDAGRPEQWRAHVHGEVPLYVFPFNLIGNLPDPAAVFDALRGSGGYGLISAFNSDVWTTEVRRDYYTACGITLAAVERAPYSGVRFRGADGFVSQSFSAACFDRLLHDCGLEAVASAQNHLGQCVTVSFG
ncbi:hypothetical protein JK358_28315 [Nocardia sp. 2]|uniref:Class I SAM-dependent methyltransferase n=1 Tax=Nocardia acididurans TaxID=2802282 RepID=A0ABS1MCE5_9NOCA|nr:methyltransferase domain-containing protein [Nocardia acididurans]MBL1078318.1 hypothetical protein [Nocardia acididurans]